MRETRILTVCTANICRSPAASTLLRRGLSGSMPDAVIASAGTAALEGHSACDLSSALVGDYVASAYPTMPLRDDLSRHRSRRVHAEDLERADLILALDRSHRSAVAQLLPSSRRRTFTLRQAATVAAAVAGPLREGRLPDGAPPIPDVRDARFLWWVEELDALRAFVGALPKGRPGPLVIDPLDIPDPHVVGYQYHPVAVEFIERAVDALVQSVAAVMEFGSPRF